MTDYEAWLAKVRAAMDTTGVAGAARWIALRLGIQENSTSVKIHRMLAGQQEPRGRFIFAVIAWLDAGCPVVNDRKGYTGAAGGRARAEKLSPERRREIAVKANQAKAEGGRRKAEGKTKKLPKAPSP